MYTYTCQVCGNAFESRTPYTSNKPPKYCSWDCQHLSMRKQSPRKCLICDTEFYSRYPNAKYCSHACFIEAHKQRSLIICPICGIEFSRDKKAIIYCSQECYGKSLLSQFPRVGKEFSKAVRKAIKERDNYTCVLCGSTHKIQVDHILAIGLGGDNSIENGRVLCSDCHKHKTTEDRAKIRAINKRNT